MAVARTLILTAVQMESRAVRRALEAAGIVGGSLQVMTIGIGGARLPSAAPADCRRILLAGLAGGLDPALKVGDVVVDVTGDSLAAAVADLARRRAVVPGRIHTSATPLLSPAGKAALFRQTGAAAVDMEGDIVRRWAAAAGVPFLHMRAISDAAGDSLDPAVLGLVDEIGRPRAARVAAYALRHPLRLAALAQLGSAARLACANVAAEVIRWLEQLSV